MNQDLNQLKADNRAELETILNFVTNKNQEITTWSKVAGSGKGDKSGKFNPSFRQCFKRVGFIEFDEKDFTLCQ